MVKTVLELQGWEDMNMNQQDYYKHQHQGTTLMFKIPCKDKM